MPASIFNGTAVKILKKILRFKDSNVEIITGDTDSPAVVAKSAPQGSIYIQSGTSNAFQKQDNGSSTNWTRIVILSDLVTKADVDLGNILPIADVDFNGQKLVDVADPTLAQDVATMNYVDTQDALYIPLTQKAANNGVATLDAGGKIPSAQLPNTVMEFQGVWDASTNTPTLADGVGNAGDVYLVTVAGTQNLGSGAQTFAIGDWVVYSSTNIWQKSINSNAVVSVNGQQGVVVLTAADVNAATQELDNLGTTAINVPLLPDADNSHSLGSDLLRWTSLYALELTDSTATKSYDIETRTIVDSGNNQSVDAENRTLSNTTVTKLTWAGTDNTTHASIVPNANNTLDLGNTTTRFNNVYASSISETSSSPAVTLGTNAELVDNAGTTSVDWPNRQLQSGATVKLDWSGTDVSLNTRKLTNVVDPTAAQDAATKNYVDTLIGSPPTMQIFTTGSGTYTTPVGARYIRVRMVGAGGGGSGTGSGAGAGTSGGATTFGTALLTANGASTPASTQGGAGGTASIASPAYGTATGGGSGTGYTLYQNPSGGVNTVYAAGGSGGSSFFGGGGGGGGQGSAGQAAIAHGAGGGGAAGEISQTNNTSGVGGGAGGFVDAYISSPSASYSYAVGAGGGGGAAGTSGQAGGAGADGYIEVTEFY